jgi:sulfur carrier protein
MNSASPNLTIVLNGQARPVPAGTSVAELLSELSIAVGHVAVEVNLELVPRARHAQQQLADGDRVEVVTLVGGG